MKKDKSRDRKRSNFERDVKIKKVKKQDDGGKNWRRLIAEDDD